jgi:hypothetical protein
LSRSSKMEAAYGSIQKLAAYHISKNPDFDFQAFLEKLRNQIDNDTVCFEWSDGHNIGGLKDKIMPLVEYNINGYGEKTVHRRNHFMISIFRIAESEPATVFNLLKIGVYTGLVKTGMKVSDYPEGVVKLFRDFKLDQISNYISKTDLNAINDVLSELNLKNEMLK